MRQRIPMRTRLLVLLLADATLAAAGLSTAHAGSPPLAGPEGRAAAAGCAACHLKDKKLLGPAYHDIAAKYKADAAAPALLAGKVRSGSKGTWGPVPMTPTPPAKISDADLASVIAWILKQ
jgi:cytochrome c